MTFSIAGHCARSGAVGIAITTSSIAVGARCPHARAGVGAVATQNITDPNLGPLLLDCMAEGLTAKQAIDKVVQGRPINLAAFRIHAPIHAARSDCAAAAHAHSLYGKTWSALGRLLDPITQDACQFYKDHGVHHEFRGVVYESHEGENIAKSLGQGKAVILRNHGLLTVGQTVDEAAWWFITMERCCQSQLLAQAAGKPILIDDANATRTQKQLGTHYAGWFAFQNLWQRIIKEQPDLIE